MLRRQIVHVVGWVAWAGTMLSAAAFAADVPHRPNRITIDGDAGDWAEVPILAEVVRPAAGEEPARAVVRLAWDRGALWALFEVADPAVFVAPVGIDDARLFQWDSVEIYLGGRGAHDARMGVDDFQIIVSPDGRTAVLQGDPLLLELEDLTVPKRERPGVAIAAAGRRHARGYTLECAVPFAAVGIVPEQGRALGLDLGLNDWLLDHPPLEQLQFDLGTLNRIAGKRDGESAGHTLHGLAGDAAARLERAIYRPWSWSGTDDFGHPADWRTVRLTGRPALGERVIEALGVRTALVVVGLAGGLLVALGSVAFEWRHRRRVVDLLARIAQLEDLLSPIGQEGPVAETLSFRRAVPPPVMVWPDALGRLAEAAERQPEDGQPEPLELRVIRIVRRRLDQPVSPVDLAASLNMSLRSLQRDLGAAFTCTPSELILAVKMREARRLLESGERQVQEVGRRVGFPDPAHFSRRFKAYFGVPPAAVRRPRTRPAAAAVGGAGMPGSRSA